MVALISFLMYKGKIKYDIKEKEKERKHQIKLAIVNQMMKVNFDTPKELNNFVQIYKDDLKK